MATAVNLKGVGTGFEPVPEGVYEVALKEYKVGPSKSTPGETSYSMTLAIQSPEDYMGQNLFYSGGLQVKSMWGFKRAIAALGAKDDVLEAENVTVEEVLEDLKGNTARVVATIEDGQRGKQNRIRFLLPGEEVGGEKSAAGGW